MKHLFIINPAAGKGKSVKYINIINKYFINKDEYVIEVTKKPKHATEIVRNYVSSEDYCVYSIGGDGTLNEVVNGMVGSNSVLGVIPCGTGNDFAKTLYGKDEDTKNYLTEEFIYKIVTGKEKDIDVCVANKRYFINISSLGLDAEVNKNVSRFKRKLNTIPIIIYIIGIFVSIKNFKTKKIEISMDGKKFEEEVTLTSISNGKYYGGGFMITPNAKIDDGYFDVCIAKKINKLKILKIFHKVFNGNHGKAKEISFYNCKEIRITSKNDFLLNIDGEEEMTKEAFFKLIPKGITIKLPK